MFLIKYFNQVQNIQIIKDDQGNDMLNVNLLCSDGNVDLFDGVNLFNFDFNDMYWVDLFDVFFFIIINDFCIVFLF